MQRIYCGCSACNHSALSVGKSLHLTILLEFLFIFPISGAARLEDAETVCAAQAQKPTVDLKKSAKYICKKTLEGWLLLVHIFALTHIFV